MLNQEAKTEPAAERRIDWFQLAGFLLICAAAVFTWIEIRPLFHHEEKPLSEVKAWAIESVEQMPYIQGELKQEFLKKINEANQNGEVQGIVSQAQKDNGAIRVIVAARHVHYCDEGIMSDGHYVCWDGKVSQNSKESE